MAADIREVAQLQQGGFLAFWTRAHRCFLASHAASRKCRRLSTLTNRRRPTVVVAIAWLLISSYNLVLPRPVISQASLTVAVIFIFASNQGRRVEARRERPQHVALGERSRKVSKGILIQALRRVMFSKLCREPFGHAFWRARPFHAACVHE